jgi:hypothetical protein
MEWLVLVAMAVVAVLAAVAAATAGGRRLAVLRKRFGRPNDESGRSNGHGPLVGKRVARGPAESRRGERVRRRDAVDIWPQVLPPIVQARYSARWRRIQLRFVYEPAGAVREADSLVSEVLRELGYGLGDLDSGNGTVPVSPELLADYAARCAAAPGPSETDIADLRRAFVHDRALFDQLLSATPADGR